MEARPETLAQMMLQLQEKGCHNINFVTPEHVAPQILEALPLAVQMGLRLPLVYNTGAYDSLESIRLMEGVVDIYMPDFKYWDEGLSAKYLKARKYPQAAKAVIREMQRQVGNLVFDEKGLAKRGVLVRHLVMPGNEEDSRKVMRYLAQEVSPHTYINIMDQYRPAWKVTENRYREINRRTTSEEHQATIRIAREEGLYRFDARDPLAHTIVTSP